MWSMEVRSRFNWQSSIMTSSKSKRECNNWSTTKLPIWNRTTRSASTRKSNCLFVLSFLLTTMSTQDFIYATWIQYLCKTTPIITSSILTMLQRTRLESMLSLTSSVVIFRCRKSRLSPTSKPENHHTTFITPLPIIANWVSLPWLFKVMMPWLAQMYSTCIMQSISGINALWFTVDISISSITPGPSLGLPIKSLISISRKTKSEK
mgnify:CR=1 FL=1